MKNTVKNLLLIATMALFVFSCKNDTKPEIKTVETGTNVEIAKAELDPNATYDKAEFTIEGMTCAVGCAKTIEKKLAKMEGVKSAKVDYDKKLAMVEYDNAKVTTTTLEETVKKVGDTYTVKEMKTVESFSAKKACDAECKKKCKEKNGKTCTAKDKEECKKKCEAKKSEASTDKKTACATDCKKACCSAKA